MKIMTTLLSLLIFFIVSHSAISAQPAESDKDTDTLVVVWTSDDPYVAERVAFLYTHTAKTAGWFGNVNLIIWGPSAKLAAENKNIQDKLQAMQNDGVVIEACVVCADSYGVSDELRNMGFRVKGMGLPLTEYLKSGAKVLTF